MYREGWAGVEPQTRVCLRSPSSPGREKCVLLWFECFSLSGVCDVTDCWCIWSNLQLHKTKFSCFQTLLMLTNDCPGCCLLLLSYLTCTSSTFLFPYWAERLGEWWARHWPWAALAPLQVCVLGGVGGGGWTQGNADVLTHIPTEQKHTVAWARSSLLVIISDQSCWSWLLLAC